MSGPFPLALQGVGYVLVAAHLWKKGHVHSDHHETNEKRKRQVTLARLLIVAYVWNLACFMPVPVFHTAFPLFWNGHEIILLCLRTLELCGSAGTPVIFLLLGTEYQTGFKAIFSKLH
ncbi:uncharacterized protein LOC129597442 [Paramacrobiotus metropolitanus]|uniref:uncharacterized protein LOC129597442 n=1 Tax=Paramacrobiotus metropolitanus TaxID=2943436 RepID=UPI0024459BE2|nr:uncharacterized protein LOC129597442 [Paramacrobiotus metropolitanus]